MAVPVLEARRLTLPGLVAGALVAVAAAVLGALFSGAALPATVLDPGPLVRWGLPVVTVLAELAASLTLGGLFLAAFVLPRSTGRRPGEGRAWPTTVVVAAVAAGCWTVLGVAELVLTYADVTGRPIGGETFGAELGVFIGSIALGRILLWTVIIAAATCVVALLVTTPRAALLTGLLATSALVLRAQTGHASGSVNHHLAISSMFLHIMGAALWIGGLAALAAVVHRLGRDLVPAVTRYSSMAAWCFVAVGVSGVVNAGIRIGGIDGLSTRYGVLVLAKAALLAAIGALGWAHRRATIPRLEGPRGGWRFWRLVAVELAVMGAVSGVAVALGSTAPPVPQLPTGRLTPAQIVTGHPLPPEPTFELWLTTFRWDVVSALGCLAAAIVYVRWTRRLRARGDRWPLGRTVSMLAGLLLLAWTTSGGPAVYGHVLFSAHMVQHMTLAMIIPIFIALSAPVTLAARALPARKDGSRGPREWLLGIVHSKVATFFANPVIAATNFAGSMVVFYFTDLFALALSTYLGHLGMIAHFTLAGYLFINAVAGIDPGPQRPGYPLRLLLLFATMAFHAFFGVTLVGGEVLLAPEWFGLMGRPWGESALADQQTGGAVAWGIGELPMLSIAIAVAVMWSRSDERTARRRDRAADRDGDAELNEYNAMLARIAERDG